MYNLKALRVSLKLKTLLSMKGVLLSIFLIIPIETSLRTRTKKKKIFFFFQNELKA